MKPALITALVAVTTLAACADKSASIAPTYVPPMMFQSLSCQQLGQEAQRISAGARQAVEVQDRKADNDAAATAVSLLLFWPAAFMIGGDGDSAAQVARLKGEMVAIEQANTHKNCNIRFNQTVAG